MVNQTNFNLILVEIFSKFHSEICKTNLKLELIPRTNQYIISEIKSRRLDDSCRIIGRCAPLSKITLLGLAHEAAMIPDDATHFCWLYPLDRDQFNVNPNDFTDEEINVLKIGGFAYFQLESMNIDQAKLLRVNSLVSDGNHGLIFDGPFRWFSQYNDQLWKQNRFHVSQQ